MATYYADFDGVGGTEVGTAANPWLTMADAVAGKNGTPPAAGDTIYCRGTDTLAATVTNALNGDETGGLIKWMGCSGSGTTWTNDGTRAVLTGGAYATLTQTGGYNLYENFGFTGSTNNDGVEGTGDVNVYVNCAFYGNNQGGYNGSGMDFAVLIRCTAYGNGTFGFTPGARVKFLFCSSHDNTQDGFNDTMGGGAASVYFACIAYDNGDRGFDSLQNNACLINCVADGNTNDNALMKTGVGMGITTIIGCRFTNAPATMDGVDMNTKISIYGWNYFGGNANDITNSTIAYALTHNGTATNTTGGTDTNQGYTSTTNNSEDWNLRSDATIRRTAISVPLS